MAQKFRILLVEDIPGVRDSYHSFLEKCGFVVTSVGSVDAALGSIDMVTYHVALVDIMLAGEKNTGNRDGLKVIEAITKLGEGTKIIPLTAQAKKTFVRDVFKDFGVFDYIDKVEDITEQGGWQQVALPKVQSAAAGCEIDDNQSWTSLVGTVLGLNEPEALMRLANAKIRGYKNQIFMGMLPNCVQRFQPLKPLIADENRFQWDEDKKAIVGKFWSKALGRAVKIGICDASITEPELGGKRMYSRKKGKVRLIVDVFEDGDRSLYT